MLRRLLAIAGLTALVVTQPILDLFGNEPASTFGVHRIEGRAILVFALAVACVPPLALWLVGEGIRRIDPAVGDRIHVATVAVLGLLFALLLAREFSTSGPLNLLIGVGGGVGIAAAYRRFGGVRTWVRILAAANLLFLFQFAFASPAADWMTSTTAEAVALEPERVVVPDDRDERDDAPDADEATPPSVVMIVLDEFPTQSLLDADGAIDEVRFPNLAAFAEDATWYRRHTTINPFTKGAVPALLDGREPFGGFTWQDHPDNLFSLLAGTHHLVVSEVLTRMCGFEACQGDPVAPPPPEPEPGDPPTTSTTTTPAVARPTVDRGARWGDLWSLAWDSWVERVRPAPGERPGGFDDFHEEFTTARREPAPPAPPEAEDEPTPSPSPPTRVDDERTEDEVRLDRFFATHIASQPGRHQLFLDALRPTDDPILAYLHLMLPHQPWTIREDGTVYDVAADRTDYVDDSADPWPVRVFRQRHLLQAEYTDRLVGQVLARLDEIDVYDDAAIVIVSDHGAAFLPGQSNRSLTDDNLPAIAYSPLLVKGPGQTAGSVDDQNVNLTDVVPTIAESIGLRLPWDVDGHPAGSPAIAARGTTKRIYDYTDAFDYTFLGVREFDDDTAFARLTADRFPTIGPGNDRIAGLYDGVPGAILIGADPDDHFGPISGTASVAALDRLIEPGTAPPLGEIAGTVPGAPDDATVVVAVNDTIVGVSPVYRRGEAPDNFVVFLPADALRPTGNEIRVAVRTADGAVEERAVAER